MYKTVKGGVRRLNLNNLAYYWAEAFRSLYRNSWLCLAAVGTIIVSLLILGSSLLLVFNANYLAKQVESEVELSVFIVEDTKKQKIKDLGQQIESLDGVKSVEFISRDRALEEFKESFGERKEALVGLEENNTLPNSYRVKAVSTKLVPQIAGQVEELDGVEYARYGQGVVENLMSISNWVRTAGSALVVLLGAAAVFLIATTIRLSVYSRRREIGIMKILGATNWFIRVPFILEGMMLGLLGGLAAVVIIYYGYQSLLVRMGSTLPFMQLIDQQELILYILGGLLGAGLLLGIVGSAISVRRFLKI